MNKVDSEKLSCINCFKKIKIKGAGWKNNNLFDNSKIDFFAIFSLKLFFFLHLRKKNNKKNNIKNNFH